MINDDIKYKVSDDKMTVTIYDSYKIKPWYIMSVILYNINCSLKGEGIFSKKYISDMIIEWQAHNLLYGLHLFRKHTKDVDINIEPWYRNICYRILASIYRIILRQNRRPTLKIKRRR